MHKSISNRLTMPHLQSHNPLEQMPDLISTEVMTQVIEECNVQEKRYRDLPAHVMIWLCISMCWSPRRSIESVLKRLLEVPSLLMPIEAIKLPSRSAISHPNFAPTKIQRGK